MREIAAGGGSIVVLRANVLVWNGQAEIAPYTGRPVVNINYVAYISCIVWPVTMQRHQSGFEIQPVCHVLYYEPKWSTNGIKSSS